MTIREFYSNHLGVADTNVLDLICSKSRIRTVDKGDILLYQGDCPDAIMFLLSGVIYTYSISADGEKRVTCIENRIGECLLSPDSPDTPSSVSVEMLTPGTVITFPISVFFDLLKFPEVSKIYHEYLFHGMDNLKMKNIVLTQSAYDKLVWFIDKFPGLYDSEKCKFIIKHKHIAAFLQIDPAVFSNLLKKYKLNQNSQNRKS